MCVCNTPTPLISCIVSLWSRRPFAVCSRRRLFWSLLIYKKKTTAATAVDVYVCYSEKDESV